MTYCQYQQENSQAQSMKQVMCLLRLKEEVEAAHLASCHSKDPPRSALFIAPQRPSATNGQSGNQSIALHTTTEIHENLAHAVCIHRCKLHDTLHLGEAPWQAEMFKPREASQETRADGKTVAFFWRPTRLCR
jgi:hypothetical protein